MAKKKGFLKGMLDGIKDTGKAIGLSAKGVYYKETPQVKGRIGRAFAHDTKGGKGRISKRGSFMDDFMGVKQKRRQDRGKIVRALAKNTKGGKGRISKRPAYKQHLPKR
jgi:hypothetical protein